MMELGDVNLIPQGTGIYLECGECGEGIGSVLVGTTLTVEDLVNTLEESDHECEEIEDDE